MSEERIARPATLPQGYEAVWPAEGRLPPLWEPIGLRPHHDGISFNLQAIELGLSPGADDEELLSMLYGMRSGHWHHAYGTLMPPRNFNLHSGRHMGPVLEYPDFRSVFALISDERKVEAYVSVRVNGEGISDVLPFADGLEDLMRIIAWDSETVPNPLGYWCTTGANGPPIRN